MSFTISLSRPTLMFNDDALLTLYNGNTKFTRALQVYLRSRDSHNLKSENQAGNGKINVDCFECVPSVDLLLGEHLFLSVEENEATEDSIVGFLKDRENGVGLNDILQHFRSSSEESVLAMLSSLEGNFVILKKNGEMMHIVKT